MSTGQYVIIRGRPLPPDLTNLKNVPKRQSPGRPRKYPFRAMQPGESVDIPTPPEMGKTRHHQLIASAVAAAANAGYGRFATRSYDGLVIVWRVA